MYKSKIINGVRVNLIYSDKRVLIEYPAKRDENNRFNIITHNEKYKNVPFIGEFEDIGEIDEFVQWMKYKKIQVFVCHLINDDANSYILCDISNDVSYYINTRK